MTQFDIFCRRKIFENQKINRRSSILRVGGQKQQRRDLKMKQKQWKDVKGFEGLYKVSSEGEVYSVRQKKIMKARPAGGKKGKAEYLNLTLRKDGKGYSKYIHILLAEAFLGLTDRMVVDHIDGNKLNNDLSNLQVVTQKQNINEYYDKLRKFELLQGYKNIETDEEQWANVEGFDNYEVSDQGHVRNKNTKRLLKPGNDGIVCLRQKGKDTTIAVRKLVANAFLYNEYGFVNPLIRHKNSDRSDCSARNLYFAPKNYKDYTLTDLRALRMIHRPNIHPLLIQYTSPFRYVETSI